MYKIDTKWYNSIKLIHNRGDHMNDLEKLKSIVRDNGWNEWKNEGYYLNGYTWPIICKLLRKNFIFER